MSGYAQIWRANYYVSYELKAETEVDTDLGISIKGGCLDGITRDS